jgi:hypothetical protein
MQEEQVIEYLTAWLQAEGWEVNIAQHHGVDIEATRVGRRWLIEVKGDGNCNNQNVNFMTAIGQIISRMTDENSDYSIAMPDSQIWRHLWANVPPRIAQLLKLSAIFVDEQGEISHCLVE